MDFEIDGARLLSELETLATFSDSAAPAITRIVYSETDRKARAWLKDLCSQSGLAVREDAIGNLFARWHGTDPDAAAVGTGSHIDAIPNAGKYDGTVGVLGALAAIRALRAAQFTPRKSIELLVFISEEPTRFGIGCLGSRLLSGTLSGAAAKRLTDRAGKPLEDFGDPENLALPTNYYASFIELHIEQGPILEKTGTALGVVTGIAAPAALRVLIDGEGGHAGAVLMPDRRDALLGAAEIALAVEAAARATGAIDTVATTGVCEVSPGAVNSIPSHVKLEIDIRDTDLARRDAVVKAVIQACETTAAQRKLQVKTEILNADAPAACDPQLIEVLTEACRAERKGFQRMVSRAYHDSLFMSRIAPTAMLFTPCRGGVSHRPDEYASAEDIVTGARTLARALAKLAA